MLLGRERECARLDFLLDEARAGHSGTLVVRGEAGIGKTALLRYAIERGERLDFHVLRARGVEAESGLAFAALHDLFRHVLDRLERIPAPQAASIASALAVGPPVPCDRFVVCAATLSLLGALAEESPVLVAADDAHSLDPSSAQALAFAARRLEAEDVAVLFAVREGEPSLLDKVELPELALGGLEPEPGAALLTRAAGRPVAPAVAEHLYAASAGNPLALIEVPTLLTDAQLAGEERIAGELPIAPAIAQVFRRRLEVLPDETRRALVVAAASLSRDVEELERATAALGLGDQPLAAAEAAGLVSVREGRLEFGHALLRAVVYDGASSGELRAAHQALAEAAAGQKGSDRRAWHLAAAAPAHDEEAAAGVEQAALDARLRGGHAEAATAFERSARLTADSEERARRLREAANDARFVGRAAHALELLQEALGLTADPLARAEIEHLRGAVEMWFGRPMSAHALLTAAAAAGESAEPAKAARMLTDAAWACFMAADIDAGLADAERACAVAERTGGVSEILAKGVLGIALLLRGDPQRAVPLLQGYAGQLLDAGFAGQHAYHLLHPAPHVLMWVEELEEARRVAQRMADAARAESALGALPYLLAVLSEIDFRTGRWPEAYAGAAEAVRIAEETDQEIALAYGLVCLGHVEAAQGRVDACRLHAIRALELAAHRADALVGFGESVLGLLELGLGHNDAAISSLEILRRHAREHGLGEPSVVQWAPDLIEAYVRAGRADEAERELDVFSAQAETTQRTWALAAAARCRGLLADDDSFAAEFETALDWHRRTPTPFEHARTELALGERLRRARRRSDSRQPLRAALETFDRLGARIWADRARTELAASGETARSRDPYASEQLTPQELQVALVVAQGATNKEAAAALFLSPKTIETHLGRVYRKLDVRSRTELARLLASQGALAELAV